MNLSINELRHLILKEAKSIQEASDVEELEKILDTYLDLGTPDSKWVGGSKPSTDASWEFLIDKKIKKVFPDLTDAQIDLIKSDWSKGAKHVNLSGDPAGALEFVRKLHGAKDSPSPSPSPSPVPPPQEDTSGDPKDETPKVATVGDWKIEILNTGFLPDVPNLGDEYFGTNIDKAMSINGLTVYHSNGGWKSLVIKVKGKDRIWGTGGNWANWPSGIDHEDFFLDFEDQSVQLYKIYEPKFVPVVEDKQSAEPPLFSKWKFLWEWAGEQRDVNKQLDDTYNKVAGIKQESVLYETWQKIAGLKR